MKHILLAATIALLTLLGCGGGGGGGTTTTVHVTGRVLSVVTGGAPNPVAKVQIGSVSTTTDATDGSFALDAPVNSTSVLVDSTTTWGVFSYSITALTGDSVDVGDLYIGPEKVTVTGVVRNSTDSSIISGAKVLFGGRSATTDTTGTFTLADVAYSSASPTGFYGIIGSVTATNFYSAEFNAADLTPTSGVITVADVLLTPSGSGTPPTGPYTLWGHILPTSKASGTVVTLKEAGTAIRTFTVGDDGLYYFWVGAGTYSVSAVNGSLSGSVASVTIADTTDVEQRDVTLN